MSGRRIPGFCVRSVRKAGRPGGPAAPKSSARLWPGIGESCWESLPPTLCVDALGGHLARRWGALLRHLRLPRLGHQARLFVHLDPLLARNRRDQVANRFERQIVRRLEMNATLPHVELLPRRLERRLQLLELTRTPKRAHQVERAVVLLRRERDVADRLLVVSVWISRQGDRPADRAPDEALIVPRGMCLFTSARTVAIVFARPVGSEAMYCAGVLTFDGGFMDSSSSRTKCITERLKTSQRQGL